jgi:hypothetical protein
MPGHSRASGMCETGFPALRERMASNDPMEILHKGER